MAKNKNQLFTVDEPIPSLIVHSLIFEDGKWKYTYAYETPVTLTDKRRKEPIYVLGFIDNQKLMKTLNKNMVNIPIYCKQDVYDIMERQRLSDERFRREYRKHHLDVTDDDQKTFTLENKTQKAYGRRICGIKEQLEDKTIFIGR